MDRKQMRDQGKTQQILQINDNLDYRLLFNLITNNSSADSVLLDTNGKILYLNARATKYLNRNPENFLGHHFSEFMKPENAKRIEQFISKVISQQAVNNEELSININGEIKRFKVSGEPVKNSSGQVFAVFLLADDITQHHQAQQDLAGAQAFHRALFTHAQEAIFIIDDQNKVLDINPAATKLLGFSREEFLTNKEISSITMPNAPIKNRLIELMKQQGSARGEILMHTKAGEKINFTFYAIGNILPGQHALVGRDVTRQKAIEQELISSEERYRSLFEAVQEAIIIFDNELTILDINPYLEKLIGYTKDELLQKKYNEIAPDLNPSRLTQFLSTSTSKKVYQGEQRLFTSRGDTLEIDFSIIPNFLPNLHLGLMHDITKRKHAVSALRDNQARLSTLIDNTDGLIWSVDKDYRLIIGNARFLEFAQACMHQPVSPGDLMVFKNLPEDFQKLWTDLYDRALQGEQFSIEMPDMLGNKFRTMEFRFSSIYNDQGVITGLTAFGRDITERKQAEIELRESESKFRQIAERINEVFWLGAPDWSEIHYINRVYEEVWGRSCQSLYENPYSWIESIHPDDQAKVQEAIAQKIKEQLAIPEFPEYRVIRPDGTIRWVLARSYPVFDDNGNILRVAGIAEDITERKQAEKDIRDSELRYRALFDSANEAIFIGKGAKFIDCNPAAVKMFGCQDKTELLDRSPWDFSPPTQPDGISSKEKSLELIQQALQGEPQHFTWKQTKLDGSIFDSEISLNTITLEGETYLQAMVRDITKRKQAEEALRESEMRYSSLVNVSPNGILIIQDQKYVFANPAGAKIMGYEDPQEVIGLPVMDTITTRYRQVVAEREERALMGQKTEFALVEIQQPNGATRYIESFSIPYKYKNNPASLVIGIDVTDKITQEYMLSGFYKAAPLGVGVVIGRQIIQANEMFCRMTGYSHKELIHQDSRMLYLNDEDYFIVGDQKVQQMSEIGVATTESRFRRKDGSIIDVLISSVPIDSNDWNKGINTVVLDISERKQAERILQNLNEELEERVQIRTQQLEKKTVELESFSYSISHDLRAPLRAINGLSQILLTDYSQNWEQAPQELLNNILSASTKMDRLIDGLLILSRLGQKHLSPAPTDIGKLAKQVYAGMAGQTKNREITFTVREIPPVYADQQLMETALTNLISNAIKFTRPRKHANIEFGVRHPGGEPVYYLKDNGIGFNMDYAGKLFTPFQRLESDEDFEGTGVGLTIVKRIIERHKGNIWVESEEGVGTTFFFTINTMPPTSTDLIDE